MRSCLKQCEKLNSKGMFSSLRGMKGLIILLHKGGENKIISNHYYKMHPSSLWVSLDF